MEVPYFYAPPDKINDLIELPVAESRHARKVLRLTAGSPVVVVDGLGMAYRGEINRTRKSDPVVVRVHRLVRNLGEPSVCLKLAAGLSVGSKFDKHKQVHAESQLFRRARNWVSAALCRYCARRASCGSMTRIEYSAERRDWKK